MRRQSVAAIGAIVGAGLAACSSDLSSISAENVSSAQQALNGVSCDQVVLTARRDYKRRDYKPTRWTDGHFAFTGGAMAFRLPSEIPVTEGLSGHGGPGSGANLTLRAPGSADEDEDVLCQYVGDGKTGAGAKYLFDNCSNGAVANQVIEASSFSLHIQNGDHKSPSTAVSLVIDELRPCDAVTRGEALFNDRTLSTAPRTASYELDGLAGNGRACADCHMQSESFQLSPAAAEARYQTMITTGIDDPLFRPIDANDFRTNGAAAQDYTNLRAGLVRITMPLPPNVQLIDPATHQPTAERSVDVWRMVPSVLNVAITGADLGFAQPTGGPNPRGGYQLDGRVLTLQNQALGAFQHHAQATNLPPQGALDDLAAFQSAQFSSPAVANLASSILSGATTFPDPDPVLNELEQQGKAVFQRSCATCHGNNGHPSTTTPLPGVLRYSNIAAKCPAPGIPGGGIAFKPCGAIQSSNARFYRTTFGPAVINHPPTDDPGRLLLTGHPADFNAFDTTDLHGIAKTAPYFHNNRAANLDEVVDHYFAFFVFLSRTNPPGRFPPPISSNGTALDRTFTMAEKPALVAYLNKL